MSRSFVHPLAGMRLPRLVRTIGRQRCSMRYGGELAIMLASAVAREPFCLFETMNSRRCVASVRFDPPPVFIVGHWRSGTTFLHTLMSKDRGFCFPTILDALRPDAFFPNPFEKISRYILLRSLPETRPMDDVPMHADVPQEDEMALASLGLPSLFNCFYFPRDMTGTFRREVLFEGLPEAQIEAWMNGLRFYLGKLCVLHPGRRLLIKNPAHSARIQYLRKLFPGAKFIHIHRDPVDVVTSTIKLYRTVLPLVALQNYQPAAIGAHVPWAYRETMDRLLASLADVPAGDQVEIRYQDLVRDPAGVLESVYRGLGLDGFDHAKRDMMAYANVRVRPINGLGSTAPTVDFGADVLSSYRMRLGYHHAASR